MKLSGKEKATIFLSILGGETSAAILHYLPPEFADVIAASLSRLPTPTPEVLGEVFNDFQSYMALPPPQQPVKPKETEKNIMEMPYVETKKEPPITRKEISIMEVLSPLDKILVANSKKLAYLFSSERIQITAFLLSLFPVDKREEILMGISCDKNQIEDLMINAKQNFLTKPIQQKLIEYFAEKL